MCGPYVLTGLCRLYQAGGTTAKLAEDSMPNTVPFTHGSGRERQSFIYRSGVFGRRPVVSTRFLGLERAVERV